METARILLSTQNMWNAIPPKPQELEKPSKIAGYNIYNRKKTSNYLSNSQAYKIY
jgi:hypothetical protein